MVQWSNGVEYHEVGKYLFVACSKEEIQSRSLQNAMPKKTDKEIGPAITTHYWEEDTLYTQTGGGGRSKVAKWKKAREPSETDQV